MSKKKHPDTPSGTGNAAGQRWKVIAFCLIALGICLRLYHFFDNRSLWEDELFLASSLIRMDFHELVTQPLDYHQRAPFGFLWAVKLCVVLFGNQEMSLRLFPLMCSILSLFAFLPVARYFLKPVGTVVAVCILAIAPPLVYHSVEVKQYGPELLATILSLLFYAKYHDKSDWNSLLVWGAGGGILLWFSFTSLFVLAGIACCVSFSYLLKNDRRGFVRSLLPFSIWAISFGLNYYFFIGHYTDSGWLTDFWERREAFLPLPPAFLAEIKWLLHFVYSFVYYPLGLTWFELDYEHGYSAVYRVLMRMPFLSLLVLFAGGLVMYRQRKKNFILLMSVVAVAIVASALRLYPLHERLNVFLAPVGILFVAYTCDWLFAFRRRLFAYVVITVLLAAPLMNTILALADTSRFGGYKKSCQREAWMYLQQHYREGDLVYVYWNDLPGWNYYKHAYRLNMRVMEGRDVRHIADGFPDYFQKLSGDFDEIRKHRRVWVVYRYYNGMKTGDYEGQPEWYYKNINAVQQLHTYLLSLGAEKQVFSIRKPAISDIYVGLYVIN